MRMSWSRWRSVPVALALLMLAGMADAQNVSAAKGSRGGKAKGDESWEIEQRRRWWIESRGLDKIRHARSTRANAVRRLKLETSQRAAMDVAANEVWREIGASSMRMGNWVMGRVSGRINAIAPHPSDDNTVYIGSANGGVWKTVDGGASWSALFAQVASQSVGSIFVEPANANNVWVGTGDKNDGDCAGYLSDGIFLSSDGGTTWTARNGSGTTAMNLSVVSALKVLPSNTNVILAGGFGDRCNGSGDANGGLYRSTDRGATWTQVMDRKVEDIVTIAGSSTVYASAPGAGVYKSNDGGATWAITGLTDTNSRLRLAVAPSNSAVLYALNTSTLYRSDNGGTSWATMNTSACDGQCWYNLTLDVHPTDPMTVITGSIRPRRSTNGGSTFTVLTNTWGSSQQVHQDTHVVLYSRGNASRFWIGSDGGVWRTDNTGTNWVNMNSNLNITQYYDIAVHPTNPAVVFGGAQDNSSSRRVDSNVWDLTFVDGDGFMNAIDATNTNIVFQNGYPSGNSPSIYRSTQAGAPGTFSQQGSSGLNGGGFPWVTPADVAGGYHFVGGYYVSRANAAAATMSWTTISPQVNGQVSVITAMKSGTAVPVYAGSSNGSIYYTADAAATNLADVTGNYPGGRVSDIAADPSNSSRVFVTRAAFGGAKLYRSTTAGGTWTALGSGLPDIPANAVVIDPLDTNRLFVGTDVGVYESLDGGANFHAFSTGLPAGLVVSDLEIDNSPYVLTAGSYGRGAWQMDLQGGANQYPVAGFTVGSSGLTAYFTDTSTDSDGTITARSWNFGDGNTSTATSPSHTYASAGTYNVTLTVTDDDGATNSHTKSVTVSDNVLSNGVPKTGIAGAAGSSQYWTMSVPAGATALKFVTSGGTGDADLYAKFGSAPTTTVNDCKSEGSTTAETCNIATAQAGTYYVLVYGYSAFSGMSLTGSYNVSTAQTYTNATDYAIGDNTTVESPITVSGRSGNAPSDAKIDVNIIHTYRGDLRIDLVAPDGSTYLLKDYSSSDSADNVVASYTVNLSTEPLNGTWKLRVSDNAANDTGYINSWSVTF